MKDSNMKSHELRILPMDGILPGMYITVLRGQIEEKVVATPQGSQLVEKEHNFYNGRVLEVLAVDMPFIVIRCHMDERGSTLNNTLDLRRIQIMQLTKEYVKAICPNLDYQPLDTSLKDAGVTIKEIFSDL